MTIKIYCERCGFTFYRGDELTNPQDIIRRYGGRCPRCYKPLKLVPSKVAIKTSED
ncbi:MAG: hypothetical protein NDF55_02745 [archaeon GB-1867-005]|nr:hypothetical protein [Candidatus Culexmicrobium cathedralense]